MPRRTDLRSILIIGSGPIVIGQACEFDYSGTQACLALKEEGYRVILVNSNPATIMTDPDLADATYIEPITPESLAAIIALEQPDALLPTMGGQTALNCALALHERGVLAAHGVELIGARADTIHKAENREAFKAVLDSLGLKTPASYLARSLAEAEAILVQVGLPAIVRPSFTLGGFGGGVVHERAAYLALCAQGLQLSPSQEIQIDTAIYGWKEFELEVVRDHNDNAMVVCSIENLDPVGVHTGDSITVAPAQTLTDKEYQAMRRDALAILRAVGVDTGGSNVQFAVNPQTGECVVIEMNPRVSRSSALASKATGYPIARVAAKLAVGYTLDELANEITDNQFPAAFEPALDYVVTKIPRFNLEKFPQVSSTLGSQMKSVGEVMAIGRSFAESYQKAVQSLEWDLKAGQVTAVSQQDATTPAPFRFLGLAEALRQGESVESLARRTQIDPWFLNQIHALIAIEQAVAQCTLQDLSATDWQALKARGFSDRQLAALLGCSEAEARTQRLALNCRPHFQQIDTCAGEFRCSSEYRYATYGSAAPAPVRPQSDGRRYIVLGSGPNRIGQGIEFDYSCVQAVQAIQESGARAIMINCNPETVSTDYHSSDTLYFEPLHLERVLDICTHEQADGVLVQFGGQTPLKLLQGLEAAGVPVLGSSQHTIKQSENREAFKAVLERLGLRQPPSALAHHADEAFSLAQELGYPLIARPSYVLGGRAMCILTSPAELARYLQELEGITPAQPLLLERFIAQALEVDIDVVSDGEQVRVCGLMEHIEQAGVHSGDSACFFPPQHLNAELQAEIARQMIAIVREIGATGLINGQFAIQGETIYVIEVNARASRTVPFISKATGVPWVKVAVKALLGEALHIQLPAAEAPPAFVAVKEAIMPFAKLPDSVPFLSPEMKSTGEVMGLGANLEQAFYKAQLASGFVFGTSRTLLLLCVPPPDLAEWLATSPFRLIAPTGLGFAAATPALAITEQLPEQIQALIASRQLAGMLSLDAELPTVALQLLNQGIRQSLPYATTPESARLHLQAMAVPAHAAPASLQSLQALAIK